VTGREALAALRAAPVVPLQAAEREQAERLAAGAGRRLVALGDGCFTLGWPEGGAPDPADERYDSRAFPDLRLKALVCLLHVCWPDRDDPPYPGCPATLDDIDRVFADLRLDRRHALGALRGDLRAAGLCAGADSGPFKLGPAVAAWDDGHVRVARRAADLVAEVAGV
jgi:hypothetical protein